MVSASEQMSHYLRIHDSKRLWLLILLGIVFSILLYSQAVLTGAENLDGVIAVLFGLYICSRPAANMVDLLFFRKSGGNQLPSGGSAVSWLMLNILVLFTGWIVILLGTTRLICRSD